MRRLWLWVCAAAVLLFPIQAGAQCGVYKTYAARYLPPHLIDEVDEAAILAIQPKPFEVPPEEIRAARRTGFLPTYEPLRSNVMGEPSDVASGGLR